MEINLKKLGEQAIESTNGGKKMRLSENAQSMVFQLFTKNVYSNPIGTIVREITSNCFDSHVEAKVNSPVIIRKSKDSDNNTYHISFIDYGVGMSPDRIENIYMVYFESTKRVDNTQIGGFGIGGKTPLAYKRYSGVGEAEYDNSFFVITIYDGIKYYYCIYEGSESPVVSLLHSEITKEHNGTEIRIPVLEKDLDKFQKEMVRQLYYFDSIIFEGFDAENSSNEEILTNQYTIIRGKYFLFRGTDYSSTMHACLGKVAYPIDFSTLGLNSSDYQLPIAVKLEIGEVNVTVSREQLDYSEATIRILKKKLEQSKKEIAELLAKQYENIVTLEEYFNVKNEFGNLKFSNGMSMYVGRLIEQKDIDFSNFRYSFMKMPNDKQLFKFFFDVKTYGKKPSRSRYSSKYEFDGGYKELKDNTNILYVQDEFIRKIVKQAYLKEQYDMYHILQKRPLDDINWSSTIMAEVAELFNVHIDKTVDDKGKPTDYIQSLIDMQDEYFEIVTQHAQDYDNIVIPDDFVASRKKKNGMSVELRNTTIPIKYIGHYSKQRTKLDDLFNYNCPIFYGIQEDENKLERAEDLFKALFDNKAVCYYDEYSKNFENGYDRYNSKSSNVPLKKKSIMFIMLSTSNVKYMEYCKKAKHVNEFYTGMLQRKEDKIRTYFQTYALKSEWDRVEGMYKEKNFSKVSANWGKKIAEILDYIKALPASKDTEINYMKDELSKHFDLTNLKMNAEQKRISRLIAEVIKLQKDNQKVLEFIYMHYDNELKSDTLVGILKKVMSF
jgi:hypothetical protein